MAHPGRAHEVAAPGSVERLPAHSRERKKTEAIGRAGKFGRRGRMPNSFILRKTPRRQPTSAMRAAPAAAPWNLSCRELLQNARRAGKSPTRLLPALAAALSSESRASTQQRPPASPRASRTGFRHFQVVHDEFTGSKGRRRDALLTARARCDRWGCSLPTRWMTRVRCGMSQRELASATIARAPSRSSGIVFQGHLETGAVVHIAPGRRNLRPHRRAHRWLSARRFRHRYRNRLPGTLDAHRQPPVTGGKKANLVAAVLHQRVGVPFPDSRRFRVLTAAPAWPIHRRARPAV